MATPNSADVLDSLEDDWLPLETPGGVVTGYDPKVPGNVMSWPAPYAGPDDRSSRGRGPSPLANPHSSGPGDVYAFLRQVDPRSDPFPTNAKGFGSDTLKPGESLSVGQSIQSPNGQYRACLQKDGNFVLYKGGQPLWATGAQPGVNRVAMQTDGNLVLYVGTRPTWASDTNGRSGAFLRMQDDGNLVLYQGGSALWSSRTNGGKVSPDMSKGMLASIGSAVSSIGSAASSVVSGVARPIGALVTSPAHLVSDIAQGKNIVGALKDTVKRDLSSVGQVAPYAQAVLSVVPGVGQGVNAAIAAGSALAHGQPITDALVAGVKGMVPGGPIAQQALSTAYEIAKGKNVVAAAVDAARAQIPEGPARAAFDTGIALAHGANVQDTLLRQGTALAGSALSEAAQNVAAKALAPVKDQAMAFLQGNPVLNSLGPVLTSGAAVPASLVPTDVRMAAQSILNRPELRSLSIDEVARRLNLPVLTVRSAVASLVNSVERAGGPSIPHLSVANALASKIPNTVTFDQALSTFASRAAPKQMSHNVGRRVSHNPRRVIQWSQTPQGQFVSRVTEARGLDASGIAYIVDPGDSMSKIAQKVVGSASRVGELIKANPQVKDPNKINVGQRLNLPASWQKVVQTAPSPAPLGPATVASAQVPTGSPAAPLATVSTTHALIKKGSTGPDVMLWQSIIGVKADGIFGSGTEAATKAWQSSHGVISDGIVGPNTWIKALSSPSVVAAPVATSAPTTVVTYVVKSGDSPFKIAQAWTGNGARFTELADANPSQKANILAGKIQVGQVFTIPPSWGAAPNGSPVVVPPANVPQVLSQLPAVLPQVVAALPQIAPALAQAVTPTMTTIAENPASPIASPIGLATGSATPTPTALSVPSLPALPPAPTPFIPGSTSSTPTPDGAVTQTTDKSGSVVSVTQPPITDAAPAKPSTGLLIGGAVVIGALLLLGKGSSSKIV